MSIARWERSLIIISIFLALALLTILVVHETYGPYNAQQQGPNGVSIDHPWGSRSDIAVALFTGILLIVTVLQLILWSLANKTAEGALSISKDAYRVAVDGLAETRKANRATEEATKQTKRSVDAFIINAKGTIAHMDTYKMGDDMRNDYAFHNIGNGPAILLSMSNKFVILPSQFHISNFMFKHSMDLTSLRIQIGGVISTKRQPANNNKFISIYGQSFILNQDQYMKVKSNHNLCMQHLFRYSGFEGTIVQQRCTVVKFWDSEQQGYQIMPDRLLTSEKVVLQLRDLRAKV